MASQQPGGGWRVALATLIILIAPHDLQAAIDDYEFRLAEPVLKATDGAGITVRLLHKLSGKLVTDAVLFATRLDMEPDGMAAMTARLVPQPSEQGTYRFTANLVMAGTWRLSLAAKLQGETETLVGRLHLKAVP